MKVVRGQVSSIVDIDFFLNGADPGARIEDDRIAQIIKGAVYARTKQRISEFAARCQQTLDGLQARVNQAESEYSSLVSQARSAEPGGLRPESSSITKTQLRRQIQREGEQV